MTKKTFVLITMFVTETIELLSKQEWLFDEREAIKRNIEISL